MLGGQGMVECKITKSEQVLKKEKKTVSGKKKH